MSDNSHKFAEYMKRRSDAVKKIYDKAGNVNYKWWHHCRRNNRSLSDQLDKAKIKCPWCNDMKVKIKDKTHFRKHFIIT